MSTHWKAVRNVLVRLGWRRNRITIFVTAIFLLQYLHHLLHAKYRIVQMINVAKKSTNGSIPESNTFKNEGEGVNHINSWLVTNQSKDTNRVDVEPNLSAG